MNVADFIPVYGTVRAIDSSYHDDLSLSEQVFLGLQVGFTTFATTVVAGEVLGFTQGAVNLARFGAVAVSNPITFVAAATVGLIIYTGMNEPTRHLSDLPNHPWNRPADSVASQRFW